MKRFRLVIKLFLIVILLSLILIAIVQNLSIATVRFLVFGMSAPVIAVILVSLFIGFLLGILTYSALFRKEKSMEKDKKEQNNRTGNKR